MFCKKTMRMRLLATRGIGLQGFLQGPAGRTPQARVAHISALAGIFAGCAGGVDGSLPLPNPANSSRRGVRDARMRLLATCGIGLQVFLAHKKTPSPRTLP